MLLTRVRVLNFKSFMDSGEIILGAGFNILVGQNNAGKTALLEALRLNVEDRPHRSLASLPTATAPIDTKSLVRFSFALRPEEFDEHMCRIREFRMFRPSRSESPPDINATIRQLRQRETIVLNFMYSRQRGFTHSPWPGRLCLGS
jgi:predicted ATP-dependent endonuclease of OLD family